MLASIDWKENLKIKPYQAQNRQKNVFPIYVVWQHAGTPDANIIMIVECKQSPLKSCPTSNTVILLQCPPIWCFLSPKRSALHSQRIRTGHVPIVDRTLSLNVSECLSLGVWPSVSACLLLGVGSPRSNPPGWVWLLISLFSGNDGKYLLRELQKQESKTGPFHILSR